MIRKRLALWNAVTLAIVLTCLGGVLYASTRATIYGAVDADLSHRAQFLEAGWNNFPQHGHHDHHGHHDDDDRGPGVDPVQSKRVAFESFISHPRVLHVGERNSDPDDQPWNPAAFSRALNGKREFLNMVIDGYRVRIISFPLAVNGKIEAAGQFAAPLDEADAAMAHLARAMLILMPIALVATSLTGWWLTRRALRPVSRIAASAESIEANNLSERLPEEGKDEFAELSRVFNSMLDRVEGSFRSLEQAYSAQRRFISDASHELKTPLSTIKARLGLALGKEQTPERYVEHLRAMRGATDSMSSIVGDLLFLARSDEGQPLETWKPVPLASVAEEAASMVSDVYHHAIEVDMEEGLTVCGDEASLSRVLINLLDNAVRHTPLNGAVELAGQRQGESVMLQVRDSGVGIPPEDVPRVFERFYRVATARDRETGGTGLGLSIVSSVIKAHGGQVSLQSELGRGTTVTIILPAS